MLQSWRYSRAGSSRVIGSDGQQDRGRPVGAWTSRVVVSRIEVGMEDGGGRTLHNKECQCKRKLSAQRASMRAARSGRRRD